MLNPGKPGEFDKNQVGMTLLFAGAILVLVIGILSYAGQFDSFAGFVSVSSVALAVAGAFLFGGALIGFLFGIPKTLATNLPNTDDDQGITLPGSQQMSRARLTPNTNLSDISDWLTKILVGVGLTQLGAVPNALGQLATYLAPGFGFGKTQGSYIFALGVVLYALICGFFMGYLWTRLFLSPAFQHVDAQLLQDRLREVEEASRQAIIASNELRDQVDQMRR